MQLTNDVDVFAHVCGQKADTSSNYCDNIKPYDKRRFCFLSRVSTLTRDIDMSVHLSVRPWRSGIRWKRQGFFSVQFYTKTAVVNGFVQF